MWSSAWGFSLSRMFSRSVHISTHSFSWSSNNPLMDRQSAGYLFISWWTFCFFLSFAYYEWHCCGHAEIRFGVGYFFIFVVWGEYVFITLWCISKNTGSCVSSIHNHSRSHPTIFQSGFLIWHCRQQWMKAPVSPHPCFLMLMLLYMLTQLMARTRT